MTRWHGWLMILGALAFHSQLGFAVAARPMAQTFDAKGVKIRYFVEGNGEPVVLIHGLYSNAQINWQLPGMCGLLAKNYQVISLDVRGHGGSDKPDNDESYGVEMAEDVIRLLDHLKIKKAHIVGYSMGGMIAVKLMVRHPERVLSGTLGGMGWLRDGGAMQKVLQRMEARPFLQTPAACVHSLGKLAVTEEEIKAIRLPVVVLVGDHDPVKQMYVAPLTKVRKDWPVIEIADAGHLNCIIKPQFQEEIAKWLAKQTQR